VLPGAGTIEQVYLSPLPSWLVAAAGRVVAALVETLVVAAGTYLIVEASCPSTSTGASPPCSRRSW